MPKPAERWIISLHASREAARRGISRELIRATVDQPEQREIVRAGRIVVQRRVLIAEKLYLVRVFVDVDRMPNEVVTVYLTSKVAKYWRTTE
jgi:hypothetical protein